MCGAGTHDGPFALREGHDAGALDAEQGVEVSAAEIHSLDAGEDARLEEVDEPAEHGDCTGHVQVKDEAKLFGN
jgi:hypothetical protein